MVRQALGKGLDALLKSTQEVANPAAFATAGSSDGAVVEKIALTKIIPNRYQPRRVFNEEKYYYHYRPTVLQRRQRNRQKAGRKTGTSLLR